MSEKFIQKLLRNCLLALCSALAVPQAWTHSVGQIQTTKFFAPETVQLLQDRIAGGEAAGFRLGDVITYIIQFTPVANGATTGVAGYITDYLPPGVEVAGADIVSKDSAGNFYAIAPSLPGGIDTGWGNRGQRTFAAPFATNAYDPTGRCAAAGFTNNCNGRLTELHADTGIFYSTDARTAVFPQLPTRILQGLNGYNISPTAAGQLNPIIGQVAATTHNLWDASQTNAFGSTAAAVAATAAPKSAAAALSVGTGAAPFYAASVVAGPQTGYPLDNTGLTGPWQRINYPGSRIGDPTTGPATAPNLSFTAVGGQATSLGYNLSLANPLPSGTNAVRWAVGKLVVGQLSYVRIKMRVTQPVPNEGLTNSSEVFGGDAGDGGNGQDNAWRYHVPSVADNNSNLYVSKIPCAYSATATTCTPLQGGYYPAATTVTYQITYLNTGNANQSNVVLQDILPCQTAAGVTVRVGAVSGPLALSVPYTTTTASAGNCGTTPTTNYTVTFPTIASLGPAAGGQIVINVPNSAVTLNQAVINTAKLTSSQVPSGVISNAVTFVGDATTPALTVIKTTPVSTGTAGGTAAYVIVVKNVGTGAATGFQVDDILPSNGDDALNPSTRFNYTSLSSYTSTGLTTASALVTATATAALGGLTPYDTASGAANAVKVNFNFGATSSLASNGVVTLTFVVTIGSAINASSNPYYNDVVARGTAGNITRIDSGNTAPITVSGQLAIAKVLECYFSGGICIPANAAGSIPNDARVRYRIDYANTGAGTIANVVLADTLPCQISSTFAAITVTAVLSGPIAPTGTTPFNVAGPFTGNCPSTRASFGFPAASLLAGQTGSLQIDVQLTTPSTTTGVVVNDVKLTAPGAGTVTAQVQATVINQPNLLISKTASPSSVMPGGTLQYTISIVNKGTTAAQVITVYDILPTGTSTVANPNLRFNYVTATSVITGALTSVAPTTQTPPTISPYSSGAYAANQQQIVWTFTGQTLAVGATATIVFTAQAGSSLPALPPPNYYNNNSVVTYFNGQQTASNVASANVSIVANLTISKNNGGLTLISGSTTSYTVTVSNFGPADAPASTVKDVVGAGLNCTAVTCAQTTGVASCPAGFTLGVPVPAGSTTFFSTGVSLPTFNSGSTVAFTVMCSVTATGN